MCSPPSELGYRQAVAVDPVAVDAVELEAVEVEAVEVEAVEVESVEQYRFGDSSSESGFGDSSSDFQEEGIVWERWCWD